MHTWDSVAAQWLVDIDLDAWVSSYDFIGVSKPNSQAERTEKPYPCKHQGSLLWLEKHCLHP